MENNTVVCNTTPRFYTEGFLNCAVVNVALQSLYVGETTLAIQQNIRPNASLSYPFGDAGTLYAQLFYATDASSPPVEQFYCQASSCVSNNYTYTCANLNCTCPVDNQFCAGPGNQLNLTDTINGLTGPLEVTCSNSTACNFINPELQTLFGTEGLGLSGCQAGECVRQSVIDALVNDIDGEGSGSGLSGGVIAGLAVAGALMLAMLGLLLWGKSRQKAARRSKSTSLAITPPQYGLAWQNISYTLPLGKGLSKKQKHIAASEDDLGEKSGQRKPLNAKNDKQHTILQNISGSVAAGTMLAILGSSGAGKSTLVDILAGKRKAGAQSGSVTLISDDSADDVYNSKTIPVVGYVDQDDVLPAELSASVWCANRLIAYHVSS